MDEISYLLRKLPVLCSVRVSALNAFHFVVAFELAIVCTFIRVLLISVA
jgi:hypothetical protein